MLSADSLQKHQLSGSSERWPLSVRREEETKAGMGSWAVDSMGEPWKGWAGTIRTGGALRALASGQ